MNTNDLNLVKKLCDSKRLLHASIALYIVVLIAVLLYNLNIIEQLLFMLIPFIYGYIKYKNYKSVLQMIYVKN